MNLPNVWYGTVSEDLAAETQAAARRIIDRLPVTDDLPDAALTADRQTRFGHAWTPYSTAVGNAGLVLLYAEAAARWDADYVAKALDHLTVALEWTRADPIAEWNLFSGACGVALAVESLTEFDDRAAALSERFIDQAATLCLAHLKSVSKPHRGGQIESAYDVISGLSSAIIGLAPHSAANPLAKAAVTTAVRHLSSGLEQFDIAFLSVDQDVSPMHRGHDGGYFDLGYAHGAAGVLTALVVGARYVESDPRLFRSIDRLGTWLAERAETGNAPTAWPSTITAEHLAIPDGVHPQFGWCYGAPGSLVPFALQEWTGAGSALDDAQWARAVSGLDAVALRTTTLCHGTAGLLALLLDLRRYGRAEPEDVDVVAHRMLSSLDPSAPYLVREIDSAGNAVDDFSLLNGAAGVAAALLAVSGARRPLWMDLLAPRTGGAVDV